MLSSCFDRLLSKAKGPIEAATSSLDALACPEGMEDPGDWVDAKLQRFKRTSYAEGGDFIYHQLKKCRTPDGQALEDQPELRNLLRFTKVHAQAKQEKHTMQLAVSDEDYFAAAPKGVLDLPEDLKNQEFLASLDRHLDDNAQAAIAYIDRLNFSKPAELRYRRLVFDSQFLGTPDVSHSFRRFFIYVPGPDYDRFLQFGLHETKEKILAQSISMIGLQKKDPATGLLLEKPQAWFTDHFRIRDGSQFRFSTRLKELKSMEGCYECHSTALLHIYPLKATFQEAAYGQDLKEVNAIMGDYKLAEVALVDTKAYGPALGPVHYPGRNAEFFAQCAPQSDPTSVARISQAMNCSFCHNDRNRATLRFPVVSPFQTARGSMAKLLIVDEMVMPPGADLALDERKALIACLTQEYLAYGLKSESLLERWLRGTYQDPEK